MAEQERNESQESVGGPGGGEGGMQEPDTRPEGGEGTSAVGRESPGGSEMDADEALGNRTGGYGSAPSTVEPSDRSSRPAG